jgi:hypothetical protein
MAGYSGTPLPQKLGIKPGHSVTLLNAPEDFEQTLTPLPLDVTIGSALGRGPFDVVVFFTDKRAALAKRFAACTRKLSPAGGLWIAWPKKASGVPTDLTEDTIRGIGLAEGLVDNKVCAIDETWSGLRFVIRLVDRPKTPKRSP